MENNRITCVIGAGAALGFKLPSNVTLPSTGNITAKVRKTYRNYLTGKDVGIVDEMYQHLMSTLPAGIYNSQPLYISKCCFMCWRCMVLMVELGTINAIIQTFTRFLLHS